MIIPAVIVLLALAVVVLFTLAFLAPRRSRGTQAELEGKLAEGERLGDEHAGAAGDSTAAVLEKSREAARETAESGRKTRRNVPF